MTYRVSLTALRAVQSVGIIVAEPAVFNQQVARALTRVVGYPASALEMFRPAVTNNRACTPTAHERFAHLLGVLLIVVPLPASGVEVQSLHEQTVFRGFDAAVGVGVGVVGWSGEEDLAA